MRLEAHSSTPDCDIIYAVFEHVLSIFQTAWVGGGAGPAGGAVVWRVRVKAVSRVWHHEVAGLGNTFGYTR